MLASSISLQMTGKNKYHFVYSEAIYSIIDRFDEAIDQLETGDTDNANATFKILKDECPEFIDTYNHLAAVLMWKEKYRQAITILEEGLNKLLPLFPADFFNKSYYLEWAHIENRPFLRCYANIGLCYFHLKEYEAAKIIFEQLLTMNPQDDQGIRDPLLNCYLATGSLEEALDLCDYFADDTLPAIVYGKALVLFKLKEYEYAQKQVHLAVYDAPLIAEELLCTQRKTSPGEKYAQIALGSLEEAKDYCQYFGAFWQKAPGALVFLKECLTAFSVEKAFH